MQLNVWDAGFLLERDALEPLRSDSQSPTESFFVIIWRLGVVNDEGDVVDNGGGALCARRLRAFSAAMRRGAKAAPGGLVSLRGCVEVRLVPASDAASTYRGDPCLVLAMCERISYVAACMLIYTFVEQRAGSVQQIQEEHVLQRDARAPAPTVRAITFCASF